METGLHKQGVRETIAFPGVALQVFSYSEWRQSERASHEDELCDRRLLPESHHKICIYDNEHHVTSNRS